MTSVKGGTSLSAVVVSYHLLGDGTGRPYFVARALGKMAVIRRVSLIASNFDHISKRTIPTDEAVRVPVRPYATNISIGRVLSYFDFARQVNHVLQVAEADLVYICVPDYISALAILRNKRDRRFVVIVDIVDLWPEAFPLPKLINKFFKNISGFIFKPLRRWLYQKADLVLFQSRYFLKEFGKDSSQYGFLPMCLSGKATLGMDGLRTSIREEIRILFLGSLNNITDTESLIAMLNLVARHRKVCLSVVGGGHGLRKLEKRLANTRVRLIVRGITFDQYIRKVELTQAHFGFNGYKETTEVSVSYKALDYLQHGLPMINHTKGDLAKLINDSHCGLNYEPGEIKTAVEKILSFSDCDHRKMCENARGAFEENYSYDHFCATLAGYVDSLLTSGRSREA